LIRRLAIWSLRQYFGGPARSWVLTSALVVGYRAIRAVTGRRPLVEVIEIKKGDHFTVDHLAVSHRRQIKTERAQRRARRAGRA
jgi:hypothetical protein